MSDSNEKEKYEEILRNKLEEFKQFYNGNHNWVLEAERDGVKIHSIYDKKTGLKIIRSQGVFKAPPRKVVEVAEEVDVVLEWDKTLEDIKALHRSNEYYIMHTIVKKIPFTVQREAILLARFFHEPDGIIHGVSTSLDSHPEVEDTIYRVRAKANLIGWVLKPVPKDPEQTDFTLILHVDPKGWIPKPAFNWFAYNQGFNVKPFGEYVEKRYLQEKMEKPKINGTDEIKNLETNPQELIQEPAV